MSKKLKVGDTVNYHSVIGGSITSRNHKIEYLGSLINGEKIAWITKKDSVISIEALSKDNLVK